MPRPKASIPQLRRHANTNRGYVWFDGKRRYLGRWDDPATLERYHRFCAELAAGNPMDVPADILVAELAERYLAHCETLYKRFDRIRTAVLVTVELYGSLPAAEFSPRRLKAVQAKLAARGLTRGNANQMLSCVKRWFKWAASEELIPSHVFHALQCVEGLRRGTAKEGTPREPVPEAHVLAVADIAPSPIRGLLLIQLFTGARSSEILYLRRGDIDTQRDPWRAEVREHKTAHHGKRRVLYFGPRAQAVLREAMIGKRDDDHLFSPLDTIREMSEAAPSHRRPNQRPNPRKTERKVRDCYTSTTYRRAIQRLCIKAGVPDFHPHQIRHLVATRVREQLGLEAAQVALGHARIDVTQHYAHQSEQKAAELAKQIG